MSQRPATATYWIDRPEQIRALTSPIRQEIVDRLAASGGMSVADLARALGRRPTAVYHHVARLARVGLLRPFEIPARRGRPAVGYKTVAPRMRLARAGRSPRNHGPLARAGAAVATQAARDYAAGFHAPHWTLEGAGRNHWFFRVIAAPSPRRLKRLNELLDEAAELMWKPDPNPGPPISVAWFLSPLGTRLKKRKRR